MQWSRRRRIDKWASNEGPVREAGDTERSTEGNEGMVWVNRKGDKGKNGLMKKANQRWTREGVEEKCRVERGIKDH